MDKDLALHQSTPLAVARSTIAGKHLCFQLGAEIYGLPILDVRENHRVHDHHKGAARPGLRPRGH